MSKQRFVKSVFYVGHWGVELLSVVLTFIMLILHMSKLVLICLSTTHILLKCCSNVLILVFINVNRFV